MTKFQDKGETLLSFGDEFLVVCPRCSSGCKVIPTDATTGKAAGLFAERKASCLQCGFSKICDPQSVGVGQECDSYFGFPLWLQVSCCGQTLWAYNARHLEWLQNYVQDKHRKQIPNVNKSMASRLPAWMKDAKNRDDVLRCIERLKSRLQEFGDA